MQNRIAKAFKCKYEMVNFDDVTNKNRTEHNLN